MAETSTEEKSQDGGDVAAALRDRGMEHIEGAKGQLAEGAERVAAAVERTADHLEDDGDNAISGFGRSVASLMRQLAGGLREADVAEFTGELAQLARRNPGVFLAGSVALGFGIARVFKARAPAQWARPSEGMPAGGWQSSSDWSESRRGFEDEERLDLSAAAARSSDKAQSDTSQVSGAASDAHDQSAVKSRQADKRKAKPQRASSPAAQQPTSSSETTPKDPTSTGGQS